MKNNQRYSDLLIGPARESPTEKLSQNKKNISREQFLRNPSLVKRYGFWRDTDRDSIMNAFDCYPFDPSRHAIIPPSLQQLRPQPLPEKAPTIATPITTPQTQIQIQQAQQLEEEVNKVIADISAGRIISAQQIPEQYRQYIDIPQGFWEAGAAARAKAMEAAKFAPTTPRQQALQTFAYSLTGRRVNVAGLSDAARKEYAKISHDYYHYGQSMVRVAGLKEMYNYLQTTDPRNPYFSSMPTAQPSATSDVYQAEKILSQLQAGKTVAGYAPKYDVKGNIVGFSATSDSQASQIRTPPGYATQEMVDLYSKYSKQTGMSGAAVTSLPGYQKELQKILSQPEQVQKMQSYAKVAGYASPEKYGTAYPSADVSAIGPEYVGQIDKKGVLGILTEAESKVFGFIESKTPKIGTVPIFIGAGGSIDIFGLGKKYEEAFEKAEKAKEKLYTPSNLDKKIDEVNKEAEKLEEWEALIDGDQFVGTEEEYQEYLRDYEKYEKKHKDYEDFKEKVESLKGKEYWKEGAKEIGLGIASSKFIPRTYGGFLFRAGEVYAGAKVLGGAGALIGKAPLGVQAGFTGVDVALTGWNLKQALSPELPASKRIEAGVFTGMGIAGIGMGIKGMRATIKAKQLKKADISFLAGVTKEDDITKVIVGSQLKTQKGKPLAGAVSKELVGKLDDASSLIVGKTYAQAGKRVSKIATIARAEDIGEAAYYKDILKAKPIKVTKELAKGEGIIVKGVSKEIEAFKRQKGLVFPTGQVKKVLKPVKVTPTPARTTIIGQVTPTKVEDLFAFRGGVPEKLRIYKQGRITYITKPKVKGLIYFPEEVDEISLISGGVQKTKVIPKAIQKTILKQISAQEAALKTIAKPKEVGTIARVVQKTISARIIVQIPRTILREREKQMERQEIRGLLIPRISERAIAKEKKAARAIPVAVSATGLLTGQKELQAVAPIQAPAEKARLVTKVAQPTPPVFFPLEVPKEPLRITPPVLGKPKPEYKTEKPYDAYVYVEATKGKRARYQKLNKEALTLSSALSSMARAVDQTISARGKVEPRPPIIQKGEEGIGKIKVKEKALDTKDTYYQQTKHKFRAWATKKKKPLPKGVVIERQKYRLDYPGEVKKIQKERRRKEREVNVRNLFGF